MIGAEDVPRTYVQWMIGAHSRPVGFFADALVLAVGTLRPSTPVTR
jgi:hypothetical protein